MTFPVTYLISPTEHSPHIQSLGRVSSLPERHGCDILAFTHTLISPCIGYQRKTIPDLLSSLADGRLSKELSQIRASSLLSIPILIIEGTIQWTLGTSTTQQTLLISSMPFTRAQYIGLLLSLNGRGIRVLTSSSVEDTIQVVLTSSSYYGKSSRLSSLDRRPKPLGKWGMVSSRDFASHLLQSFPTIGPVTAEAILTYFGRVPMTWTVTIDELLTVPGIGRKTAIELINALSAAQQPKLLESKHPTTQG
ncbi:MAG: ERCC4 domain-containing protein [Rhabdochlamydiaceae bacterium]